MQWQTQTQTRIIFKNIHPTQYRLAKRNRKIRWKNFFLKNAKLKSNAIFGKSIENPINKIDVKVATTRKEYLK